MSMMVNPYAFGGIQVRGSNIVSSYWQSTNATFPAGVQAGDRIVMFACNGYGVNTPSGWTLLDDHNENGQFGGKTLTKVLSSGDVTTGYVTVTAVSDFYGVIAMIALVGDQFGTTYRDLVAYQGGSASSRTLTTGSTPLIGDHGIYFAAVRANSNITVPGSIQAVNGTQASAALGYEDRTVAGAYSKTFSFSATGVREYSVIVTWKKPVISLNYSETPITTASTVSRSPNFVEDYGLTPYSFAVTSGSLPSGLSINSSTGVISGTLTASVGTYPVTVTVTVSGGATYAQTFNLVVSNDVYSTKWRIRANNVSGNSWYHAATEIEMRATSGGADQTTGGTAISDHDYPGSYWNSNAFDNNSSTFWLSYGDANPYIGCQFATAVTVTEIAWTVENSQVASTPRDMSIQYWDGSAWQTWWSFTTGSWSSNQTKTFTKP